MNTSTFVTWARYAVLGCAAFQVLAPFSGAQDPGVSDRWTWSDHFVYTKESGVCAVSDQDGDGVRDVLIGKPLSRVGDKAPAVVFLSGANGALVRREDAIEQFGEFGYGVGDAGDVDADGIGDYMIGEPSGGLGGRVYVRSGADGSDLWVIDAQVARQSIGRKVGGVGDLDADGFDDFAYTGGGVFVHSGASGDLMYRLPAGPFAPVADLNGDLHDDFVIGIPGYSAAGSSTGAVIAVSGATGRTIWRASGLAGSSFGSAVGRAPDINDDGVPEVLVGAPLTDSQTGSASILDGRTGITLHEHSGTRPNDRFGTRVVGLGDFNGDGIDDYAISAKQKRLDRPYMGGYVSVYSSADHRLLTRIQGPRKSSFGYRLDTLGDVDQDDQVELLIGAPFDGNEGSVRVTGYNRLLIADTTELSLSASEPLRLFLTFPRTDAGSSYRILASYTGYGPTSVNGFRIPLSQDELFDAGMAGMTPPHSTGFIGRLGADGRAYASLQAGPGMSAWVGAEFHLAAVLFDAIGSVRIGTKCSFPLTLEIAP